MASRKEIEGRIYSALAGQSPHEQLKAYQKALGSDARFRVPTYDVEIKDGDKWVNPDEGIDVYDFTTDLIPEIPAMAGAAVGLAAGGVPGAVAGGAGGETIKQAIGKSIGLREESGYSLPEIGVSGASELLGPIGAAIPFGGTIVKDMEGWITKITPSTIDRLQQSLAKKAERLGFKVHQDASTKSPSRYLKIETPGDVNYDDIFEVRISDHPHNSYAKEINIAPNYHYSDQIAKYESKLNELAKKYDVKPPKKNPNKKKQTYAEWEKTVFDRMKQLYEKANNDSLMPVDFWQQAKDEIGDFTP